MASGELSAEIADLLICGSCRKDFPLSNIVNFVDHKKFNCSDQDVDQGGGEELACQSCPSRFVTPWRLLQHAQTVHSLKIYLEQSPYARGIASFASFTETTLGDRSNAARQSDDATTLSYIGRQSDDAANLSHAARQSRNNANPSDEIEQSITMSSGVESMRQNRRLKRSSGDLSVRASATTVGRAVASSEFTAEIESSSCGVGADLSRSLEDSRSNADASKYTIARTVSTSLYSTLKNSINLVKSVRDNEHSGSLIEFDNIVDVPAVSDVGFLRTGALALRGESDLGLSLQEGRLREGCRVDSTPGDNLDQGASLVSGNDSAMDRKMRLAGAELDQAGSISDEDIDENTAREMMEKVSCDNRACGSMPHTHARLKKCCRSVVPKKRKHHFETKHKLTLTSFTSSSTGGGASSATGGGGTAGSKFNAGSRTRRRPNSNEDGRTNIYIDVDDDCAVTFEPSRYGGGEEQGGGFGGVVGVGGGRGRVGSGQGGLRKQTSVIIQPGQMLSIPVSYAKAMPSGQGSYSNTAGVYPLPSSSRDPSTQIWPSSGTVAPRNHRDPSDPSRGHDPMGFSLGGNSRISGSNKATPGSLEGGELVMAAQDPSSDGAGEFSASWGDAQGGESSSQGGDWGVAGSGEGGGGEVHKRRKYPTSRPFKCEECSDAFNQRIHLRKHQSKHTGVKPFKCDRCDYSTVERSHLKVHIRVHTGEKPYKCTVCEYATAQNSTLKIHLKRRHHLQAPDTGLLAPDTGLLTPDTGLLAPDTGILTPDTGLLAPDVGLLALDTGLLAPDTGLLVPDKGLPAPDTVMPAPDTVMPAPDTGLTIDRGLTCDSDASIESRQGSGANVKAE